MVEGHQSCYDYVTKVTDRAECLAYTLESFVSILRRDLNSMSKLPLPTINRDLCTGCGFCIDTCPPKALGQSEGKAYLQDVAACTYCTACEDICPENAIALPFLIVLAPDQMRRKTSPTNQ